MTEPALAFDKKELRSVIGAFKAMDEQATDEAKKMGYELAQYATPLNPSCQHPNQSRNEEEQQPVSQTPNQYHYPYPAVDATPAPKKKQYLNHQLWQ